MFNLGINTTLSRKLLHFPPDVKIAQTISFSAGQRSRYFKLEEPIRLPSKPELICPSVHVYRLGIQRKNGTGPTDLVNYSYKS
jgi:hypothetical protein